MRTHCPAKKSNGDGNIFTFRTEPGFGPVGLGFVSLYLFLTLQHSSLALSPFETVKSVGYVWFEFGKDASRKTI